MKYICQNCSNSFAENELREIRNITERVMPGEIMPAGECPSCGALCHAPLHDAESPVFDALLLAYGSLCARMDPNKRPKTARCCSAERCCDLDHCRMSVGRDRGFRTTAGEG